MKTVKKIGLIDVDGHNYPNIALMKIARFHKNKGDIVEWFNHFDKFDKVYMSKIFTYTPDYDFFIHSEVEKGGTGYSFEKELPEEIDLLQPDYSIYPIDKSTAYGFLTRGCPNRCKWCVVPQKEGNVRPYMDVDDISIESRTNIILMDNNILASDYGLKQIEKIVERRYKVDFNQAMDARLVTPEIGKLLAKVKWIKRIRFGCDTQEQIEQCERAITYIDDAGYKGEYFFYCMLHGDFNECFNRVNHWRQRGKRYLPHCQPYLNFARQKRLSRRWQLTIMVSPCCLIDATADYFRTVYYPSAAEYSSWKREYAFIVPTAYKVNPPAAAVFLSHTEKTTSKASNNVASPDIY